MQFNLGKFRIRHIVVCLIAVLAILFILIYFTAIKPAEEAIDEARLAVEGLPLEYEKSVYDIAQEYLSKDKRALSLSGHSDFHIIAAVKDSFFVASDGGLLKIEKGGMPLGADINNPYRKNNAGNIERTNKTTEYGSDERRYIKRYYPSVSSASLKTRKDNDYQITAVYTISNGLMENKIKAIKSWNEKLIILYEDEGIALLDGNTLTNYRFKNPRYNRTVSFDVNGNEVLFITDKADIIAYDGNKFKLMKNAAVNTKNRIITSICSIDEGILIGTVNTGLFYYSFDQAKREASDVFDKNKINQISKIGSNVYVCSESGLYERVSPGNYIMIIEDYPISSICETGDGAIYCGAYFGDILETSTGKKTKKLKVVQDDNPVESLTAGRFSSRGPMSGTIWAVTGKDIIKMNKGRSGLLRSSIGEVGNLKRLSANFVTSLEVDNYGRIWVGYFENGIDLLDQDLSVIVHLENDDIRVVRHLRFDTQRGLMYAATSKGIIVIDSSFKYRKIDSARGLINNECSHIFLGKNERVYCTAGGITFDNGGLLHSIYAFHNLANNHTYCSLEKEGKFYIGTLGGLSIIKNQKVIENLTPLNSRLSNNWITALLDDEAGGIWIGTYGGGICKMDYNGKWEDTGFPFKEVEINNNAMISSGNMIITGTLSDGVILYDTDSKEWRKSNIILPSKNITSFLQLGDRLIVGTDAGLGIIDLKLL